MLTSDIIKNNGSTDVFTNNEYQKEYELYQSYPRFNIYNVYKIYNKTNEKIFLYRITKQRYDYGKRIYSKQEILHELNSKLKDFDLEGIDNERGHRK